MIKYRNVEVKSVAKEIRKRLGSIPYKSGPFTFYRPDESHVEYVPMYIINYATKEGVAGKIEIYEDRIPQLRREDRLKILKMIQDGGY